MLILFLFLRNIRATLIIGVSIPVSILVTLLFMYFAGFTLNIMTLAGLILGVGLIVDSSIVILENIFQYRQKGADAEEASVSGGQEVISPIIASALTTVCVFVPIILFKYQLDMIGVILNDMMVTILITIVASLITAVVLVPVLAGRVFPVSTRAQKPLKNTILRRIDTFFADALEGLTASYKKALTAALRRRALVVAGSFLLFAASLASFALLRISLVPTMETESVTLFAELPAGKSLEDTVKVLEDMESIIRNEVTRYTHIYYSAGESGDGGLETKGENLGKLSVVLPPVRQQIEDTETVKALLRSRFADFPGVIFELENESISESEYPIDIAVMSDDLEKALAAAAAIERLIRAEIAEVPEVSRDVSDAQPEIQVVIDRKKAYALGLTTQAISREIRASIAGITASVFRAGGKEYDIFLVLQDADKNKVLDLNKIFVINNEGLRVPVSGFASLEKTTGPVDIKRENQSRTVHVQGTIAPGAEASVVTQKIREKIEERLILDGVRLEYGGDWADIQETGGKIIILLLLAVGLVFGVMAGQYESLKDPFINFFTIPLLFIGVIAIYLITGQAFSMFSAIGVVMLAGIVVNNGIVLVDYTNLLRARGAKVTDACIEGGVGRLRPVLMTSLTTILATIPMAFFPGESSQMIQPIGLTVIGGLTVSTVITLFLIPVIYSLLNKDKTEKAAKRRPKN
jgi:HAE1 family hydrophobic/amphiphilic exporter-1